MVSRVIIIAVTVMVVVCSLRHFPHLIPIGKSLMSNNNPDLQKAEKAVTTAEAAVKQTISTRHCLS
jgi:hypothetical protein